MTTSSGAAAPKAVDQSWIGGDDAEVVRHYAEALVSAAAGENQAEPAIEDLEAISHEILTAHPRFAQLLASTQVSAAEKDRLLLQVFEGRVTSVVLRFLRVLNRRGRLGLLDPLAREARQIWNRRHKRVPVLVRTAVPLDSGQEEALRQKVAGMIGATPILQVVTDPALIGGLVVQVGDQVCDTSIQNRLEQVRQRLIEGKTHEIQSRRDQFSYPA
jgi:F-type H+-transporting ATPase subunit delta